MWDRGGWDWHNPSLALLPSFPHFSKWHHHLYDCSSQNSRSFHWFLIALPPFSMANHQKPYGKSISTTCSESNCSVHLYYQKHCPHHHDLSLERLQEEPLNWSSCPEIHSPKTLSDLLEPDYSKDWLWTTAPRSSGSSGATQNLSPHLRPTEPESSF